MCSSGSGNAGSTGDASAVVDDGVAAAFYQQNMPRPLCRAGVGGKLIKVDSDEQSAMTGNGLQEVGGRTDC